MRLEAEGYIEWNLIFRVVIESAIYLGASLAFAWYLL